MRQIGYAMQFRGSAGPEEGKENQLWARTGSATNALLTALDAGGPQLAIEDAPAERVSFTSSVYMREDGEFTEDGTIDFGAAGTLRFSTVGTGRMGPSAQGRARPRRDRLAGGRRDGAARGRHRDRHLQLHRLRGRRGRGQPVGRPLRCGLTRCGNAAADAQTARAAAARRTA